MPPSIRRLRLLLYYALLLLALAAGSLVPSLIYRNVPAAEDAYRLYRERYPVALLDAVPPGSALPLPEKRLLRAGETVLVPRGLAEDPLAELPSPRFRHLIGVAFSALFGFLVYAAFNVPFIHRFAGLALAVIWGTLGAVPITLAPLPGGPGTPQALVAAWVQAGRDAPYVIDAPGTTEPPEGGWSAPAPGGRTWVFLPSEQARDAIALAERTPGARLVRLESVFTVGGQQGLALLLIWLLYTPGLVFQALSSSEVDSERR